MDEQHKLTAVVRAVTYSRVSTGKQAAHDLSLPDQQRQNREYCEARGFTIVDEISEAGSATGVEQRPLFQAMIDRALNRPPEFDKIVVHSTSRLYRDELESAILLRRLEKNGVEVISVTQDFGNGPMAVMTRRIMGIVDEMQSQETAKHVKRTMLAAARQGWWISPLAPYGYRVQIAEMRGTRKQRRLVEEPDEAEVVRLIFKLASQGDGPSGRLGIKKIAKHLTKNGIKNRDGNDFYTSRVENILKSEFYTGTFFYNKRENRTKRTRPREDWVAIPIPALVTGELFREVQANLRDNAPRVSATHCRKHSSAYWDR